MLMALSETASGVKAAMSADQTATPGNSCYLIYSVYLWDTCTYGGFLKTHVNVSISCFRIEAF